jgi:hypothetical protein
MEPVPAQNTRENNGVEAVFSMAQANVAQW